MASLWMKFMNIVRPFGNGVKQLYYDGKRLQELHDKVGLSIFTTVKIKREAPELIDGDFSVPYSREELQFLYRVKN